MTDTASSPEKPKNEFLDNAKALAVAVLAFLLIRVFIFQPFTIPSASMEPGLRAGDYIVVTKFDYGTSRYSIPLGLPLFKGRLFERHPKRGDVIVFKLPRDPKVDYIKRLIGLPGDQIQVLEGQLYINGMAVLDKDIGLEKDQGQFSTTVTKLRETLPDGGPTFTTYNMGYTAGDDTELFTVPKGQYFFMGDNRDNSQDSRWPREMGVGFVPAENLVGHARIILLSWTPDVSLFKPWTWFTKAVPSRFFKSIP